MHATLHVALSVRPYLRLSTTFLVVATQLYKRLCPFVGRSVRWSVGPVVRRGDRVEKWETERFRSILCMCLYWKEDPASLVMFWTVLDCFGLFWVFQGKSSHFLSNFGHFLSSFVLFCLHVIFVQLSIFLLVHFFTSFFVS